MKDTTPIIMIILTLMIISTPEKQPIQLREYNNQICYDGDTCYITYKGKEERLRIKGIDTPEIRETNGYKAREYTNKILREATNITYKNIERDLYDRVLAEVYVNGVNIADMLIEKNLGRKWIRYD